MLACLVFLLLNDDYTYKIAFVIGVFSFVVPIVIYKLNTKRRNYIKIEDVSRPLQFKDLFPKRSK